MNYTIVYGDTLFKIATKFFNAQSDFFDLNEFYRSILQANPLITNPNLIQVGQVIYIPMVKAAINPAGRIAAAMNQTPTNPINLTDLPVTYSEATDTAMNLQPTTSMTIMSKLKSLASNRPLLIGAGVLIIGLFIYNNRKEK